MSETIPLLDQLTAAFSRLRLRGALTFAIAAAPDCAGDLEQAALLEQDPELVDMRDEHLFDYVGTMNGDVPVTRDSSRPAGQIVVYGFGYGGELLGFVKVNKQ